MADPLTDTTLWIQGMVTLTITWGLTKTAAGAYAQFDFGDDFSTTPLTSVVQVYYSPVNDKSRPALLDKGFRQV